MSVQLCSRWLYLSPCTGVLERNEAKSQQMVAEELARIVQSELVELRQRDIAEATSRARLENQLGELKVEKIARHIATILECWFLE